MVFLGLPSDGVVKFGHLRMWAERGLIHIEDSRDNSYEVVSVRTALQRMQGIQDMLGNSVRGRKKHSEDTLDNEFYTRNQKMLEEMIVVSQKAREQGMPSDPSAVRDKVRRLPRTVVVPGVNSSF